MKTTDYIRQTLEQGKDWLLLMVNDMKDAPTTFPTHKGGNHPLWVLGHITCSEASMMSKMIQGEQNPLAHWEPLFGMGSEPVADAGKYPPFAELLSQFEKVRSSTLKLLASMSDADLDKPSKAPPEYQSFFGTIGLVFSAAVNHQMFHAGQVADARRALGRKPVFG